MMNITLTDDLQRLLRKGVDDGLFASEEAAIEEALKATIADTLHPKDFDELKNTGFAE